MFMRPAEDAYPLLSLTQLTQSLLASLLSPSHWCVTWNGVTPILSLSVGRFRH